MPQLVGRLDDSLSHLKNAIPRSLRQEDWIVYERAVRQLQLVNLRHDAAKSIFDVMGLSRAPAEFTLRAIHKIRTLVDGGERPVGLGGFGRDTTRIFAYAEYELRVHFGVSIVGRKELRGDVVDDSFSGYIFRESGRTASQPGLPKDLVLRAMRLPNSGHVDRNLCAEFQLLVEMCGILGYSHDDVLQAREGNEQIVGVVSLFTTHTPCMSCLGAMRQFQLMYPEIDFEVSEYEDMGSDLPV